MRIRYVFAILGGILIGIADWAEANSLPELPYNFSVKWNISKKDNLLIQDFVVNRRMPLSWFTLLLAPIRQFKTVNFRYSIYIAFEGTKKPLSPQEVARINDFVGRYEYKYYTNDPNPVLVPVQEKDIHKADEMVSEGKYQIKYDHPGVTIPVSIKLEKIDKDKTKEIIPQETIYTHGSYEGFFNRLITKVILSEGRYRIYVNVPSGIKTPSDVETALAIDADYRK
jgi:hypothetical protein